MYFKVSEIIEVLGFEVQLAPVAAWLREAEQKGLVKKKIGRGGIVMYKFRWFKQKDAITFLEDKYINCPTKFKKGVDKRLLYLL